MSEENESIGLIAGGGQFPLMVAEAASKRDLRVVAVAHVGETDQLLSKFVHEIVWIKLGQMGKLIKVFRKNGIKQALMAGSIDKSRMFDNVRPDLKGLAVMSKLAVFHDDNILGAFADELEKAKNVPQTVQKVLKKLANKHARVIFNGDNYADAWVDEAAKRGDVLLRKFERANGS